VELFFGRIGGPHDVRFSWRQTGQAAKAGTLPVFDPERILLFFGLGVVWNFAKACLGQETPIHFRHYR